MPYPYERSCCHGGLQEKAGVAANQLRWLVLKEIADNALDAGAAVGFAFVDEDPDRYFIEDDGPGLHGTPQDIAELFSIARPLRSSKLLRLPQRGQVGNGLRVVAGAVLASSGTLAVVTHNQRIALRPESDGSTRVVKVTKADSRSARASRSASGRLSTVRPLQRMR
jgi:hypothetical protein